MTQRLTPSTALLLVIPPLLWAGNSIVGRLVHTMVPPMTFNFLRWLFAFLILLPLAGSVFRPSSELWQHWRRFAILGLLGVGMYNALQYLALQSSTPINVTLVGASMPVWMLLIGRLFFGAPVTTRQVAGALISIAGVLVVLSRGEWQQLLALRLVLGDVLMIVATISWSVYSWLLVRQTAPAAIRNNWSQFLLAQIGFGVLWSGLSTTVEWTLAEPAISWSWPLVAAMAYVATGPAIIAYRCWGTGVQRVGPSIAAFFNNLTPLFAAVMSSAFLHERPQAFHAIAFVLIVAGIVLSSRRP